MTYDKRTSRIATHSFLLSELPCSIWELETIIRGDVDEIAVEESDSVGVRAWVLSLASAGSVLMSPAAALVSEHKSVTGLPAAQYQHVAVYWKPISNKKLRRS